MTAQPTPPMQPTHPMQAAGAVWCDEHSRWECSHLSKRSQARCHSPAIRGTATCRMHPGTTSAVAKAKGQAFLAAWSLEEAGRLGPLNLHERMLALIHLTTARHAVYAGELQAQYESEDGSGGLVGATWVVGRAGEGIKSGEQLRALTKLEGDERDRLARYLKSAHDMGIATQALELAQAQAEAVVLAFHAAIKAAGAELLPAIRAVMVSTFLEALGRGAALEIEGGGS